MASNSSSNTTSPLSNNGSDIAALEALSLLLLRALAPWATAQTILSLVQVISSLVLFFAILISKNLRENQTFIVMANIALNDGIFAASNFIIQLLRVYAYFANTPWLSNNFYCIFRSFPGLATYTNSNGFLFLLALNRLMGVAAPIWYKQPQAKKLLWGLVVLMYLRTVPNMVLMYLTVTDDPWGLTPLCGVQTNKHWAAQVVGSISIPWTTTIGVLYVFTIATTYVKLGLVRRKKGNMVECRNQLQVRVVLTLAMILFVHVTTTFWGNLGLQLIASHVIRFTALEANYILNIIFYSLVSTNTTLYLAILARRSDEFKKGLLELREVMMKKFRGPVSSVSTFSVPPSNGQRSLVRRY